MANVYPLTLAQDPEIHNSLTAELNRQENQIELIASENHASMAVMETMGSVLTNKYAEGYPGRRYYGGCEHVDDAENLAKQRLCEVFKAESANVQPSSGSQANQAALLALAPPGSRILAMDLNHGGHLSHGHPKNLSGMIYEFSHYGVNKETERIDYDAVARQVAEVKPKILLAGASAYPRSIDFQILAEIAQRHEAFLMVDMAHIAGLVAASLHDSPVPYADIVTMTTHKTLRGPRGGAIVCKERHLAKVNSAVFPGMQGGPLMHVIAAKAVAFKEALAPEFATYQERVLRNAQALAGALQKGGCRLVSGGTDNHLMLVDLRGPDGPGITGRVAEDALHRAGITANKNLIPFDPEKPMATSGLRLGTPAVTTRGFDSSDMESVGDWMNQILRHPDQLDLAAHIGVKVAELCASKPLYPNLG